MSAEPPTPQPSITILPRAAVALGVGAAAGATAEVFFFQSLSLLGSTVAPALSLVTDVAIFVVAFVIWSIGLFVLSAPVWWFLHRRNARSLWTAMALGGLLVFLACLAPTILSQITPADGESYSAGDSGGSTYVNNTLTLHGWFSAITACLLQAVIGAGVGAVVWRTAYRPPR